MRMRRKRFIQLCVRSTTHSTRRQAASLMASQPGTPRRMPRARPQAESRDCDEL
jgi:hypothetical protein